MAIGIGAPEFQRGIAGFKKQRLRFIAQTLASIAVTVLEETVVDGSE